MPPPDIFSASTEFYVRYVETDSMRVVNHAHYISWLEESRSEYARARGRNYADFEKAGFALAVVEVHLNYKNPARYGDRVRVTCWVLELRTRSVTFSYEVQNADTGAPLVNGFTRHICIQMDGAAITIPIEWRGMMQG